MVDLWLQTFMVWSWLLFVQQVAEMNPNCQHIGRAGRWHSCQTMGSGSHGLVHKPW